MGSQYSGAGVLFFEVVPKEEPHLIVVFDNHKKSYVDPGGCGKKPLSTAQQELFEESGTLLYISKKLLRKSSYINRKLKNGKYYRAYLFFSKIRLDKSAYHNNLNQLQNAGASHIYLETSDIQRIPVSLLYKSVKSGKRCVTLANGKTLYLHNRVLELLEILFEDGIHYFLEILKDSLTCPVSVKKEKNSINDLVHYIFT